MKSVRLKQLTPRPPQRLRREGETLEPTRINSYIGAQLRSAREASGLTLKTLANSMGVTPSLLSQIETDKVQPSLNTLFQLVSRLNLSMDALLGIGPERSENFGRDGGADFGRPTVQKAADNPALEITGGVRWERLAGGLEGLVEPLVITYPPGSSSSPDGGLAQYQGYEFGLLLEGTLTLCLGFDTHVLEEGDSVHFDAFRPHAYENRTGEDAKGVWFVVRDEMLRQGARTTPSVSTDKPRLDASTIRAMLNIVDQADW